MGNFIVPLRMEVYEAGKYDPVTGCLMAPRRVSEVECTDENVGQYIQAALLNVGGLCDIRIRPA